jgi:hypothetical protein
MRIRSRSVSYRVSPAVRLASCTVLLFLCTRLILPASASPSDGPDLPPVADGCNCNDMPDLVGRLHEVHAAIAALKKQSDQIAAEQQQLRKAIPYTPRDFDLYIANWVNLAMDSAAAKDVHRAHGPTHFTQDCAQTIDLSANTACLWEGVLANELVWQQFCQNALRGGADLVKSVLGGNWMERYPLTSFVDVEIRGYRAEEAYLRAAIDRLLTTCKFSKWSGTVTVAWKETFVVNISLPRPGENPATAPHGSDVTTSTSEVNSTITVIDGVPYGEADIESTSDQEVNVSGKTSCHGGGLTPKPSDFSRTVSSKRHVSGPVSQHGAFSVTTIGSNGSYSVSVTTPEGYGRGGRSYSSSETGECAGKPANDAGPIEHAWLNGVTVTGTAGTIPGAKELNGGFHRPAQTVQTGDVSRTTSYEIHWDLRRQGPSPTPANLPFMPRPPSPKFGRSSLTASQPSLTLRVSVGQPDKSHPFIRSERGQLCNVI